MMQPPPIINRTLLTNQVTPEVCTSNLVAIDDTNYQSIVDWFKECLRLSTKLDESERDDYQLGVISNVKNSLSDFFQRTELSLGTLIGLDREISSLFENVGPFDVEKEQQEKSKSCYDNQLPTCCEVEDALNKLYKNFMFVVVASFILLLLFIVVLATLCWLRKCVAREIKERVDKLKAPAPMPVEEEEEEEPEEEEEEMGEFEYGYDNEYYPARVLRPTRPMRRRPVIEKRVKFKPKPRSRPVVGILKRSRP